MNKFYCSCDGNSLIEERKPRIPHIIHRSDLVPRVRRGVLALIAFIGWALWFYLIEPLLALVAWIFGYRQFQAYFFGNPKNTIYTFEIYSLIIAAAGSMLLLWAIYNWLRFRRIDRRRASPIVTEKQLAADMGIDQQIFMAARNAQVMTFEFDKNGGIVSLREHNAVLEPSEDNCAQMVEMHCEK